MNQRTVAALRALLAAYESHRVYGLAHPGSQEQSRRCAQVCAEALGESGSLSIVITDRGVVINEDAVPDDWAAGGVLIDHLRARGVEAIRMTRGVDQLEINWLLDSYAASSATISPAGHIVLGRVRGGTGDGANGSVLGREVRLQLKNVWTSVMAGRDDTDQVTSLVNRVLSATMANRAGLIKLANLKNHDEYTFVHVTNVAILASALGETVGVAGDGLRHLTEAALLHDIGKWMLPKRILVKAGELSEDERLAVQMHPVTGAKILATSPGICSMSIVAAFEHHRRIDGGGYPRVPRGRAPSILSQVVQVADIFDALRSDRPYRAGLPANECLDIMSREAGRSFDAALFEEFRRSIVMRLGTARDELAGAQQRRAA